MLTFDEYAVPKKIVDILFDLFTDGYNINEKLKVQADRVNLSIIKIDEDTIEIRFHDPKIEGSVDLPILPDFKRKVDRIVITKNNVTIDIPDFADPVFPVK